MSINIIRQTVLDTETTGMNKTGIIYEGHRIIEIGIVEIINRRITGRNYHVYLKPDRCIDAEAFNVHKISDNFLKDKPTFSQVVDEFLEFIYGSELVIHNASFDINFINYEISMLDRKIGKIHTFCKIIDSLKLARKIFPGKRNNLDALCNRYLVDNSKRIFHGALLDAEILAEIFLLMTSGQTLINFSMKDEEKKFKTHIQFLQYLQRSLKVICANHQEMIEHKNYLHLIKKKNGKCLWK